ncbi:F0F1 ATP synthase subunit B [Hoeflea prorocentri]|uniref:ATP synthase subunit b n=1 Tax=Hoeflea prorocentri TaxID=1922333 RepID=A0A9X3ZIH1_9HYPH|nr:F0F1 ATP synthase subunit B [Hoeflea prorocentri]MCY6381720.1 F0F1 ATP synthase subunit B [Hoeflea prorocentri]MDA5399520.1 F0F1 ATP synthase subunit B [Hoeflea prorocentri]
MDASFWALVSLILFLALLAYLKVPGMLTKSLDDRADKIRNELDEARRLREEAQQLLAEYQRKRKDAEKEASEVIAAAEHEAAGLVAEARQKTDDYVKRRTAMAEQKIALAEAEAVNEVRQSAIDIAVSAAQTIIADKADEKTTGELFKSSVAELKERLN